MSCSIGTNQNIFYRNAEVENVDLRIFPNLVSLPYSGQYGVFSYCTALKTLVLPPGITSTPLNLCTYCSSLKKVTFSHGFTTINNRLFYRARSGIILDLPETLTTITNVLSSSNESTLVLILRGDVGSFDGLISATRVTSIYVLDEYLSNYQTYLAGSSNLSKLKPLSEYVET
ncbi:MAG: leucine-rich repeat protein [Bacteroidales bacterium]|nr:leucine-rich repeat protein [Bacteroidales bacterium]